MNVQCTLTGTARILQVTNVLSTKDTWIFILISENLGEAFLAAVQCISSDSDSPKHTFVTMAVSFETELR